MTVAGANTILQVAKRTDAPTDAFTAEALDLYEAGMIGNEAVLKDGGNSHIPAQMRSWIYQEGQKAAGKQVAKEQAVIKAGKKTVNQPVHGEALKGYSNVRVEGDITRITEKRTAELNFVEFIAKEIAGGNTVYVYESYVDKATGKRVYKDSNGDVHKAPNGTYTANGEIWLDLNAGMKGEGFILNTFAHEMTHFIREWSPAKFKKLANFLNAQYGEAGVDVKTLVRARMAKSNLDYATAYEEVVADSMEKMFTDGDIMSKLQELKKQDADLVHKLKEFIDKWVGKLSKWYKGSYVTHLGEMASQLDKFEQLQQLFAEALVDAGDSYQQASLTPGAEGTVYDHNGDAVPRTEAEIAETEVEQADHDLEVGDIGSEMGALYSPRDVTSWDIAWDEDNNSTIKSQMVKHMAEINRMNPVATIEFDKSKGKTYAEILGEILHTRFGYKIDRADGASFLFDKVAIATLRRYVNSDEEAAAVTAAPYVLKRGKAISGHKNHKKLGHPSVTYAGPVVINGERVNVGVVVLFGDKNRPHSLRVLMPSGKEYVLKKIETDPKRKEASPKGAVRSSTGSASTKKVTQLDPKVKRNSDRDNAPVFYSQMAKVIDGMKQEKFGASSVISMLRGRGVKAEEIRWSGIQAFLDGKKSVTKAELLEFIQGSMLNIGVQKSGNSVIVVKHSDRDYSYDALVNKPDMVVTAVGGAVPKNRADVVYYAKRNAASVGKTNKNGSVSVYVADIGADVILGTDGLRHGLRRTKDPQNDANYIVTMKAGEILKNSIKINEVNPKKDNVTDAYVMIGVAKNHNGDLYIVRSIVNRFSNELDAMDVLYAINAKKEELAALEAPRSTAKPLSLTSSTISIAELLDYVKEYFPDVLPGDVLKHFGHDSRPEGVCCPQINRCCPGGPEQPGEQMPVCRERTCIFIYMRRRIRNYCDRYI